MAAPLVLKAEEEPLELGAGRLVGELAVRLGLRISQELHQHGRNVATGRCRPLAFRRTSATPPGGVLANLVT